MTKDVYIIMGCQMSQPQRMNTYKVLQLKGVGKIPPVTKRFINKKEVYQTTNWYEFLKTLNNIPYEEIPHFVRQLFYEIKKDTYEYTSGSYKDVFLCHNYVVTLEIIHPLTFSRRETLHRLLEHLESSHIVFGHTMYCTNNFLFQKLEKYEFDAYDLFTMNKGERWFYNKYIHRFVNTLTGALLSMIDIGVFPTDLKPENILCKRDGGFFEFAFTDLEEAFIHNRDFMEERDYVDEEKRSEFIRKRKEKKLQWVRSLDYIPDKKYPACRSIAIRNVAYAWAKIIYHFAIVVYVGSDVLTFYKDYAKIPYVLQCYDFIKKPIQSRQFLVHLLSTSILNIY